MKGSLAIIALSTVFLSTAAFAQSAGEKTGVNSTLGITPKTADFIKEAATSDMLEIDSSKLAQQKGNATEKTFAGQMITDHTKTSSELKSMVAGDLKAAIPTALDDSSQKKLDNFAMPSLTISRRSMIRCKSAHTRMLFRCSSVTLKAATIPN
jgi:putative membrane protein